MAGGDGRPRPRGACAAPALVAAALALAVPPRAGAVDLFSPGPLARGHAQLEGLARCTECHPAGERLSSQRCIACHRELEDRIGRGRGLHGRIPAAERACETCHHEHQGRDFALVDWGPPGRDRFDHARAGWPLRGKHATTPCAKCHDRRLVQDPAVKALLEKRPERTTWLGTALTCRACHFDDHRGQVSTECERCHGEKGWKPARGFDHARTRYPLRGKHAKVACARCHPRKADEEAASGAFPAPVSATFLVLKPIPFARCLDCHKDPHKDRFGDSCESCHGVGSWKELVGRGRESAFHLKTRYPLEGAHVAVACKACHGPFGREKARWRNLAFRSCADCHLDSHVGQLARNGRAAQGCDACHGVQAWSPVRYDLEEHGKAPYPLAGAHVSVPCALCHPRDERLLQRVPAGVREELALRRRPVQASAAALARPGFDRCETCHKDPHAGQLARNGRAARGCAGCHMVGAWSVLAFDHQRDSRYPLAGKHAKAACAACHPRVDGVTRYRPLETACAACHADAHAGQLARGRGPAAADCARCHDPASWKAPSFVHAPPFTPYRLRGKHAKAKCDSCHKPVVVAAGVKVARYRPLPAECEGCHSDFHRGAFRGYVP
jgi:hypothetical protein